MKRGFELFKTRNPIDELDIKQLEELYRFKLPPLYKLFAEHFILGCNKMNEDTLKFRDDTEVLRSVVYEPNPFIFAGLTDVENNLKIRRELEEWEERDYLPIGSCPFNGALIVGTKEDEVDRIILHNFDIPPFFTPLANNIFEFVKQLVLVPSNNFKKYDETSIYKNWGEDFWRIREE